MGVKEPKLAFKDTIVAAYERRLSEYKEFDFPII